jgi:hypothetical protein
LIEEYLNQLRLAKGFGRQAHAPSPLSPPTDAEHLTITFVEAEYVQLSKQEVQISDGSGGPAPRANTPGWRTACGSCRASARAFREKNCSAWPLKTPFGNLRLT